MSGNVTECGHAADDSDCKCWGLWKVDHTLYGPPTWCHPFIGNENAVVAANYNTLCAEIAVTRKEYPRIRYEVRMFSAPPKREPADRSFQLQCDPPSAIQQSAPHSPKCSLIWCSEPAVILKEGSRLKLYCSSRCHDYDTKRAAIYHRLESYKTKLARHQDKGMTRAAEVALASEVAWAEQQTKSEADARERQWRALTWRT